MNNREAELEKKVYELQAMLDNVPFEVWMKNVEGEYIIVNNFFAEALGKTKEEVLGKKDYELYPPDIAEKYTYSDSETLKGDKDKIFEWHIQNDKYWKEYKKALFEENGDIMGTVGYSGNITKEVNTRNALFDSEERFKTIFEMAPLGMSIFNTDTGYPIEINKRFAEIVGRTKESIEKQGWISYSHPDDIEENLRQLKLMKEGCITSFSMNKRLYKLDGTIVWVNMTNAVYRNSSQGHHHICMLEDITERKKYEQDILYLSYYDQLTGLYNRRFYETELKRLDVNRNLPITIVMADVNGLKITNDAFGHNAGDELLKNVARILKCECRNDDIISRIGGDEFLILLPNTSAEDTEEIIERINDAIHKEKTEPIICSVAFGWATKVSQEQNINKIYIQAENEMYRHKLSESSSMRSETIKIITKTLYQKNKREQLHCERVSSLCKEMGEALNFSTDSVNELKTAGLLHDIGLVGINESALNNQGKLSDGEWSEVKRHPEIGYQILRSVTEFASIAEYVLYHHERVDGKGYPGMLSEKNIPLQSKIICIIDAFDAMTGDSIYRAAMSEQQAIEEMRRCSGTQFDAELLEVFITKVLKNNVILN